MAVNTSSFEELVATISIPVQRTSLDREESPPIGSFPLRHLLGVELLKAGHAMEAEAIYGADLKLHPANGWALVGLSAALDAEKKSSAAAKAKAELEARGKISSWSSFCRCSDRCGHVTGPAFLRKSGGERRLSEAVRRDRGARPPLASPRPREGSGTRNTRLVSFSLTSSS